MGVQRTAFRIENVAESGEAGLCSRLVVKVTTGGGMWSIGEQRIHAVSPHVDVPLVGMETIPVVPVDAMEPQRQRHSDDSRQQEERPGNPAVQAQIVNCVGERGHRGNSDYLRFYLQTASNTSETLG